jgi:hypothetical protein
VLGRELLPHAGTVSTPRVKSEPAGAGAPAAPLSKRIGQARDAQLRLQGYLQGGASLGPQPSFDPRRESFWICPQGCGRFVASPRRRGILEMRRKGGEIGIPPTTSLESDPSRPRAVRDTEAPQRRGWKVWGLCALSQMSQAAPDLPRGGGQNSPRPRPPSLELRSVNKLGSPTTPADFRSGFQNKDSVPYLRI